MKFMNFGGNLGFFSAKFVKFSFAKKGKKMIYIGYAATIYLVISAATAAFVLGTRQASLKGFSGWRIARWFMTAPLLMLEELLASRKGR